MVFGPDGQVGWECCRALQALAEVLSVGRASCDLNQPEAIRAQIRGASPDLIINAAAYTAVDRAESEPQLAHAVNAVAPAIMAEEARRSGASLIHLSTDYVFDGRKTVPYMEDDPCYPLSVYGRTKRLGEEAVLASGAASLVLRTTWVYAARGRNFVRTILQLAVEREELRVVDDQWGAPTWARSVAEAIAAITARAGCDRESIAASFAKKGGIFHLAASGRTTWYRFARRIVEHMPPSERRLRAIVPIPSSEFPTAARRPMNSVLDCSRLAKLWGVRLPAWELAHDLAFANNA